MLKNQIKELNLKYKNFILNSTKLFIKSNKLLN